MDGYYTGLVLPAIPRTISHHPRAHPSQTMALAASAGTLVAVMLFGLVVMAFGNGLLRVLSLKLALESEHLLCAAALGVISIEVLLFFAQMTSYIRLAIVAVVAVAVVAGAKDIVPVVRAVFRTVIAAWDGSSWEKFLVTVTALVLLAQGFAAMAPVTGSDALHYHFAAPLLELRSGFHANFFLSHSFFCGQSHLLILLGLAFGSSQLAMGIIFLGGLLAAVACACLTRRWASPGWSWTGALVFLLTPVVFWQISTAGAPDIWMAFFATVAVIVVSRAKELPGLGAAILAGALAGAVAGTKYTGCIIAASIAVAFCLEVRRGIRWLLFSCSSLVAGIWPYARNLVWTGDPVFPFLTQWVSPQTVNSFTLASYRADTGAASQFDAWRMIKFLFFAGIDQNHLGFWQFLGPVVLAFSPLLLLRKRESSSWRSALIVWGLSAVGIGWSSSMMRFLLPVFPIALAVVVGCAAAAKPPGQGVTHYVSVASLVAFVTFGAAGFFYYERAALSESVGFLSRDQYLLDRVPDYEAVRFTNKVAGAWGTKDRGLVFMRHVFYLDVPFVYGDPAASWAIDPARYQTGEEWRELFRKENIKWVAFSGKFPQAIAGPLSEMESKGELVPAAETEVSSFKGFRIADQREQAKYIILRVKL
jgi:hypothetical protein